MTPGTLVRLRPDYVGLPDEPFTEFAQEGRIGVVRMVGEQVYVKFNAEGAAHIGRLFHEGELELVL